jgi:cytochrome c-type biogenesis protein CcmF
MLTNSVLLVVATGAVLLGTLYPLIIDALNLGKLSVGPPYFNLVFAPLMVPLLFILIPGTAARWREAQLTELLIELRWVGLVALVMGCVAPLAFGAWSAGTALGWTLGAWVGLGTLRQVVARVRKPGRIPASFWGMHLAHLGLAVVVVGVTGVKSFEVERDVRMGMGDEVSIAPYTFRLVGMKDVQGPNYQAVRAEVEVLRDGKRLEALWPEKRRYVSSAMPMTEAAIDSGFMRDLYVSMGDRLEGDRPEWSMRVYYKPFVPWLWGGVLLMVMGGVAAALDRRYRQSRVTAGVMEGVSVSS